MEKRTNRRTAVTAIAVMGVGVIIVAAVLFQPWQLFLDTEVDDADPFLTTSAAPAPSEATSTPTTAAGGDATPPSTGAAPTTTAPPTDEIRVGTLRSLSHTTSGTVRVGPTPDGNLVVFIENLATDNGPDVKVYLSPHAGDAEEAALGTDELNLGPMKGNIGNQTYEVPAGTDLSQYQSVVLWCERFSVGFGVAGLEPQ